MAFTKVTGTLVDIGDLDLTNVGQIQLDSIAGDADANTSITFSGSDVITIATGGAGRLTIGDGALSPVTDNQIDLGTSSLEFKDAFFDGTVTSDALTVSGTTNLDGAIQVDNTITVGVDDTGYDVKFFGDTASAYMLWDASADDLILGGSAGISAQALTASGVTKLNGGVVFNEDSADVDFRVESNDSAHMLHVDGGENKVLVQAVNTASVTDSASMVAASAFEINGNSGEGSDILRFFAMADGTGNYGMEVSNSGGNAQYDLALNPINGGAVLIGATTNAVHGNVDDLQVGNGVGSRGIGIHSGNTSNGAIFFSDTDSTLSGQLEYVHASDYLSIITGGNQRLRIDAHGVKFNTNTAETDALDDYEEGNWTVGVSSSDPGSMSVTVSNGYGWYVKVGNMVTVGGSFDLSTSSPQGTMRITGLPYSCSSNGTRPLYVGVVGYTINVVPQPNLVTMGNGSAVDYLDVWKIGNNSRYNVSDFNNGGRMNFQISYEAD